MGKISITDVSTIESVVISLQDTQLIYFSDKTHEILFKQEVLNRLFLAEEWCRYALDLKNYKSLFSVSSKHNIYSPEELILQIRLLIIKLRTVTRTPSINNAIKYLIEVNFYLKKL